MPCTPESMVKTQMAVQAGSSGYHGDATRLQPALQGSLFRPSPLPPHPGSGALRPHPRLQQLPLTVPVRTKDGSGKCEACDDSLAFLSSASAELRAGSSEC